MCVRRHQSQPWIVTPPRTVHLIGLTFSILALDSEKLHPIRLYLLSALYNSSLSLPWPNASGSSDRPHSSTGTTRQWETTVHSGGHAQLLMARLLTTLTAIHLRILLCLDATPHILQAVPPPSFPLSFLVSETNIHHASTSLRHLHVSCYILFVRGIVKTLSTISLTLVVFRARDVDVCLVDGAFTCECEDPFSVVTAFRYSKNVDRARLWTFR